MTRRPGHLTLAALVLLLALAGCGGGGGGGATGGSSTTTATATSRPARSSSPSPDANTRVANWPLFGRVPQRTHYLPLPMGDLNPPLKVAWTIDTHALIEFPPAIAGGVAYIVNKFGNTAAIRLSDQKTLWYHITRARQHGNPTDVTGPVYHAGRVYYAGLGGYLISLDSRTGKVVWMRDLHAHLESSPLVVGRTLYIGTDSSQLLALDAATGRVRWSFDAPAPIKASPSYDRGVLFVPDYRSGMFALVARTGKVVWRTNTSTQAPFGRGGFYSSPAIAFGHVYSARDDGVVFAFDQKTGKVDWSYPTGGAIYGSPAVARVPGTPPTVYIGSETGRFYALAARTGKVEWSDEVGGPVPGTATVVGDTVFTSSFATKKSIGIDVRTHRRDFTIGTSGYTPVVSDGRHLYVAGYFDFIALESKSKPDLSSP
ncbi:MAG: PQQ-binding-like beta-propeller repeat protein [Actinobacteria bacterium]|nr:PQQ-binding-like beta-propeller repeat protein [Actinomycetota bacterium]